MNLVKGNILIGWFFYFHLKTRKTSKKRNEGLQNEVSEITTFHVIYFHMGHFIILLCLISCEKAKKNVSAVEVSAINYSK